MLGTAINGAVSSPVSGGVPLYRDTFLAPSFGTAHPEFSSEIHALQDVLDDYIACVIQALKVHGKLCKDIAYHEALKSRKCPPRYQTFQLIRAEPAWYVRCPADTGRLPAVVPGRSACAVSRVREHVGSAHGAGTTAVAHTVHRVSALPAPNRCSRRYAQQSVRLGALGHLERHVELKAGQHAQAVLVVPYQECFFRPDFGSERRHQPEKAVSDLGHIPDV